MMPAAVNKSLRLFHLQTVGQNLKTIFKNIKTSKKKILFNLTNEQ